MSLFKGRRLDLAAYGLLFAGLLLALCIFSHDPAIQPSVDTPGSPMSSLAWFLFDALGIAVYVLLANWFVLVVLLLLRQRIFVWLRRLTGWLVLLPCTALLGEYLVPYLENSSWGSDGGALGIWLADWLELHLQPALGMILLAGCTLLGLTLAFDFALLQLARKTWQFARRLWNALRFLVRTASPASQTRPTLSLRTSANGCSPLEATIPIHHPPTALEASLNRGLTSPACPSPLAPRPSPLAPDVELPPLTMLEDPQPFPYEQHEQRLRETGALLEKVLADFDLNVRVVGINTGPVVTQFELALETGLRVAKVMCLADDIALNLSVPSVRIAPVSGKNTIGVEVPNAHRAVVRLKEVICASADSLAKMKIPLFIGKDTEGKPLVYDLAEMPHLLIAGRTGTGKSVCMNAIILSILMTRRPDEVKMIMIDPKMLELSEYGKIPHLMHPVVKDMKKAEAILAWAVDKMEERYDLLSRARVRNIAGYNALTPDEIYRRLQPADEEERAQIPDRMPYIVIYVDEMNDLMMTMRKEVEGHIIRLAQKSRAAGIHLVVATQKPTAEVITTLIKSNLPARICFQVSSHHDSKVALDEVGAERLLGKGDMLFLSPNTSTLTRAQGTYASDEEISRVVGHLECEPNYAEELVKLNSTAAGKGNLRDRMKERDELYEEAVEVVVREGRGSTSLLQRALGIGYGRAAKLIDFMSEDGIVGGFNGSQAREVLYTPEQWDQLEGGELRNAS